MVNEITTTTELSLFAKLVNNIEDHSIFNLEPKTNSRKKLFDGSVTFC